ncbi:hypothetical protein M9Y10_024066 [Tritrichomonas musculus]|uniref:10 kDa chaperonin n=1 Tax=Tritrichomonas musculus TaxID=1915356 RepID=A0ABR2KXP8_9EUKA
MLSFCKSSFARFFTKELSIQPIGSRILVELDRSNQEKVGGIYVPQTAQQESNQGIVKAVGPGRYEDGKLVPTTLKVGNKVLMPKFGGQVVKLNKKEYTIIDEDAILAVFE